MLAIFFGGSSYLSRINIAGEAGYDRTIRVTQDEDARVTDYIQGAAGGQPRGSIPTHGILISPSLLLLGWTVGKSLTIRFTEVLRTLLLRGSVNRAFVRCTKLLWVAPCIIAGLKGFCCGPSQKHALV